jgi:4-hydroxybenzoate polyprenyltransferase
MSATTVHRGVSADTLLRLGRVSNLPTVWSNVLAATVLAGGDPWSGRTAAVLLAMSLFYVGGMYLNDAFDREIDARERPTRPIPAGTISPATVFVAGFGMLGGGVLLMSSLGLAPGLAGLALAGAVVAYDRWHKANPLSPLVMGFCRALVYIGAALVVSGALTAGVLTAALALCAHVVGLTYAAKQESLDRIDRLWPLAILVLPLAAGAPALAAGPMAVAVWLALAALDALAVLTLHRRSRPGAVPRSVAALIAAISVVDALFAASMGATGVVLACLAAYALTSLLQRIIPGT